MKKMKNNLDERQEQALLNVEKIGCWLCFWGLLVAIFVQQLIYGFDFRYIAGEWIIFMILAIYLVIASLRKGIWDRHLKANRKTNLIASVIAAVVFGILMFLVTRMRFPDKIQGAAAAGVISGVSVFVLCFIALSLMAAAYKRRVKKMEEEPEEEEFPENE